MRAFFVGTVRLGKKQEVRIKNQGIQTEYTYPQKLDSMLRYYYEQYQTTVQFAV